MKIKSNKISERHWWDLTVAERNAEVARFDREIDLEKETRPLSPKMRLLFERMQRSPSKPFLTVPVNAKLLRRASSIARKQGISLEEFVASSIRGKIASSK